MAEPKPARVRETREAGERPMTWRPPEILPTPTPEDGYVFRWVRISTMGESDPSNMSSMMRSGWVPVKAEDHPEVIISANRNGCLEFGGLVLCKMPAEMARQRDEYYRAAALGQMEAVDNTLMADNDARNPLFNERHSSVSFGRGQ